MCEQLSDSIKGAEYAYKERGSTGYEYECIIIILWYYDPHLPYNAE